VARPLSEEKRHAILAAAAALIAEQGVSGPVAKIAKQAGVAEGTVFTYFADKNVLLNELYLWIKADLASVMTTGLPSAKSLKVRCRHVWDRYIEWGAGQPLQRKAMSQLTVSDRITAASKQEGGAAFREVSAMLDEILAASGADNQSAAFIAGIMESLAETTLSFIAREPAALEHYKQAGFDAFWGAVSKK
jgi:AcrR family transcriptional regulator